MISFSRDRLQIQLLKLSELINLFPLKSPENLLFFGVFKGNRHQVIRVILEVKFGDNLCGVIEFERLTVSLLIQHFKIPSFFVAGSLDIVVLHLSAFKLKLCWYEYLSIYSLVFVMRVSEKFFLRSLCVRFMYCVFCVFFILLDR